MIYLPRNLPQDRRGRVLTPPVLSEVPIEQYDQRYQPSVAGSLPDPMSVLPPPLPPPPQGRMTSGVGIDGGAMPPVPPKMIPDIGNVPDGAYAPPPPLPPTASVLPPASRAEQAILDTPPPPKSERRKGFGGRVKDVLETFLLSGGNPLTAGIAAFNPDILTRFKDQQFNEPRWQKRRKEALGEAESLDEADRRGLLNEATQAQIANLGADNQRQANKDAYDLEQKRKDALSKTEKESYDRIKDSLSQRANLSKDGGEYASGLGELMYGKDLKNRGNIIPSLDNKGYFRQPSTQQEQARKLEEARAKGEADLTLDLKKDALLTPRKLDVIEETERIRKKYDAPKESPEDKDEKERVKRARVDYNRIKAIRNRAAQLDEESKGIADKDKNIEKRREAKANWDTVRRELAIAAETYPDLIEGGDGDGGYPYVKFKEPTTAKPAASGGGTLSRQAGNYKAGDTVKLKSTGKRHRILRFENGQPVLDPNPIQ